MGSTNNPNFSWYYPSEVENFPDIIDMPFLLCQEPNTLQIESHCESYNCDSSCGTNFDFACDGPELN